VEVGDEVPRSLARQGVHLDKVGPGEEGGAAPPVPLSLPPLADELCVQGVSFLGTVESEGGDRALALRENRRFRRRGHRTSSPQKPERRAAPPEGA